MFRRLNQEALWIEAKWRQGCIDLEPSRKRKH